MSPSSPSNKADNSPALPARKHIALSSCLVGVACRYDGRSAGRCFDEYQHCLHFCPEMLGGLGVPRSPCEIDKGDGADVVLGKARVLDQRGFDHTPAFALGAQRALELCRAGGVECVILKENSPSCGVRQIYNAGKLTAGKGVTAAVLSFAGIRVISEEELKH